MKKIDWMLDDQAPDRGDESMDSVTLLAPPTPRLVPNGCRVQVTVWEEEMDPTRNQRGLDRLRVFTVGLVDESGGRDRTEAGTRFASTDASGACWSRIVESWRFDRDQAGERYLRVEHATGWRLDGFASDLPPAAMQAMRDVFTSAAGFVDSVYPELFATSALKKAMKKVADAESAVDQARADLRDAKKAMKKATRRVERETMNSGVQA